MKKAKPVNPYTRLVTVAKEWAHRVRYPKTRLLRTYKRNETMHTDELFKRVQTADMCGFATELRLDGDTLKVFFVERVKDDCPWELR